MTERSARQKMIESAALLMRERGVEATSFSDVLEHSGAPRGSIYHHFPGGKAQLIEEATRYAGEFISERGRAARESGDPLRAIDGMYEVWRRVLNASTFAAGCPIVAATIDAGSAPGARDAAGEVFQGWERNYADVLVRSGLDRPRARALATLVVAAFEGAIILARAQQSLAPLKKVRDELHATVAASLPER